MVGAGRVMQDGGRIDAAAKPDPEGHIGEQMLACGFLEQRVELFFRGIQSPVARIFKWQLPITVLASFSVAPFEPVSGRELFDSFHERPGARDVIQGQVAIEAGEAEPAGEFGMDEKSLELRAEQ